MDKKHFYAILLALFVTMLWSTSFVFIKYGLAEVPAVTFAGMRYTLAAVVLIVYMILSGKIKELKSLSKKQWMRLIILGLIMYFLNQGALYLGLYYLPAIQVSLFLNFTPVIILAFSTRILNERPTRNNLIGVGVFLIGILIYFLPLSGINGSPIGYVFMIVALLSNGAATMMGRSINKERTMSPVLITTVSMAIGGVLLLGTGFVVEEQVAFGVDTWLVIAVLAVLNTAIAFSLWNKTMQVLTSVETSMINNTMLVQIAILAWLFLNEPFTLKTLISIIIVSIGVFLVQYRKRASKKTDIEAIADTR